MSGMMLAKANARLAAVKRSLALSLVLWTACVLWDLASAFLGWDARISAIWGSSVGFPLKEHPWWGVRAYTLERGLGWAAMLLLCIYALAPARWLRNRLRMARRERVWMLVTVILALLWIQWLKRHSHTSCPWDLVPFGGTASYVPHWLWGVADGGPGRCFPAGHPSAAWAYLAVPTFVGLHSLRWARRLVGAIVGFALMLGLTQVSRGAHFVSHVLWTGWWCSLIASLSLCLWAWLNRHQP